MSVITRIPLQQVFRNKRPRNISVSSSSPDSSGSISSSTSTSANTSPATSPAEEKTSLFSRLSRLKTAVGPVAPPPRESHSSEPYTSFATFAGGFNNVLAGAGAGAGARARAANMSSSSGSPRRPGLPAMMTTKGTRTPQMLEYERQAEERAREMAQVEEDRARMNDELDRMTREQERIAQEEYEMRQYYEAEALRHAEEMRLHKEEVRRHQERVRDHERRIRDHEASSEAFAKVIVMPAQAGRQISFMAPGPASRKGNGGSPGGANGSSGPTFNG